MTVYQAEATRLAEQGKSYGQIAGALKLEQPKARSTCEQAFGKLERHLQLRDREYNLRQKQSDPEFLRELLKCFRNRQSDSGQRGLIGILPYREDPNSTFQELQALRQDPSNYQDVPLRGAVLTADDFRRKSVLGQGDALMLLRVVVECLRTPMVAASA
jgi:hypothetical protein